MVINFLNLRAKDLSDDQRKERAANLIMRLVENCQDFGEDDDEYDEDEDDQWEKMQEAKAANEGESKKE